MSGNEPARPLGIAFLGCGWATRLHSRTLRGFPDVTRFYASRDAARGAEFCSRFEGAGSFDSYDAAMRDPRVDVVLVATPPPSHLDLTLRALAAGKHVIVEKPAFLHAADVSQVEKASASNRCRVFVAENYFYKPLLGALREIVASGELGEIRFLWINALKYQAATGWRGDAAATGGGTLFESGVHWISFLANLGLPLQSVSGVRAGNPDGPDRSMLIVAKYDGGAVGTLAQSWEIRSPLKGARLSKLFGTEGSATFESNGVFLVVRGKRWRLRFPGFRDMLGYRAMFTDFFAALRGGREPAFTLALARRDLELVEQALASARE